MNKDDLIKELKEQIKKQDDTIRLMSKELQDLNEIVSKQSNLINNKMEENNELLKRIEELEKEGI